MSLSVLVPVGSAAVSDASLQEAQKQQQQEQQKPRGSMPIDGEEEDRDAQQLRQEVDVRSSVSSHFLLIEASISVCHSCCPFDSRGDCLQVCGVVSLQRLTEEAADLRRHVAMLEGQLQQQLEGQQQTETEQDREGGILLLQCAAASR